MKSKRDAIKDSRCVSSVHIARYEPNCWIQCLMKNSSCLHNVQDIRADEYARDNKDLAPQIGTLQKRLRKAERSFYGVRRRISTNSNP